MRTLIFVLGLTIATYTPANHTSETVLYDCRTGSGEKAVSIRVTLEEDAGGEVHTFAVVRSSKPGGKQTSGLIEVSKSVDKKVEIYSNELEHFVLKIIQKKFDEGTVIKIQAEGSYVDASNRQKVSVPRRWLNCD